MENRKREGVKERREDSRWRSGGMDTKEVEETMQGEWRNKEERKKEKTLDIERKVKIGMKSRVNKEE